MWSLIAIWSSPMLAIYAHIYTVCIMFMLILKFSSCVILSMHIPMFAYHSCPRAIIHFLKSLLKANVWKLFIAADVTNLGLWINVSFWMWSALVNSIQGQMISSRKEEYIRICQPEGSKRWWYVTRSTKRSFKEEILLITQLKFSCWHFTNFPVSPKTFLELAKLRP